MAESIDNGEPVGLEFPCDLDIKVFLLRKDNNLELVRDVLLNQLNQEDVGEITSRESRAGKYEAFTCRVHARSRVQMDDLYRKLTSHPEVVMVI